MGRAAWLLALLAAGFQEERTAGRQDPHLVEFYGDVQPILAIHCAKCHAVEKPRGGLRLDVKESVLKGGDSGEPAVVPGEVSRSALLRRIASMDAEERMPPKGERLGRRETEVLRKWVEQGAAWPAKDTYWAFTPPVDRPVPGVRHEAVAHPVDAFIQSKLESAGLAPAPPAEKTALLRRAYADLIGVPPSPEEADAFLGDAAPGAWERLLDRLLADPRYGERWARHWLDLVRYAESNGFENDKIRPHAWRYRDYVIRSLNADKPYDRFVLEQVAGDELWPGDGDAIVATGFARLGAWDDLCKNEGQRWQDYLNDATDTVGSVFLGFTVGCARCHDHKYDRVTQRDYYSLQAFFAGAKREARDLPGPLLDPEPVRRKLSEAEAALRPLRGEKRALLAGARARVLDLKRNVLEPHERVEASDEEVHKVADLRRPKRREALDKEIRKHEAEADLYRPRAEAVCSGAGPGPKTHILKRGELHSPGVEVSPGVIAAMGEAGAGGSRRTDLARWIASPANPMTARVIVNRVWQHHFGQGLVATPSDFGRNGRPPSHPELLDWLARRFVADGWRLKSLHRLMMTSAAWQRSSKHDPEAARLDPQNRLLWRMNRMRLEGESLRDSILAVSGRLNPRMGGPGVYAKISKEVLIDLPNNDKIPSWGVSPEEEGLRRTIYVTQRRALMLPIVEAFDGADMNHTCPKRAVTTVAPQALALFNGEFARGEGKHLAERVAREAGEDRGAQVERAYRLALVRKPTAEETLLARAFLDEQARRRLGPPPAGTGAALADPAARKEAERASLADFCHVLLNTNEFAYTD